MAEDKITKVFRITKKYRNGEKIKHIIVTIDVGDDMGDYAEESAIYWADNDPAGSNYGYKIEWEEETDKKIIKETISKEIDKIEKRFVSLEERMKYLKKL